MRVGHFLESNLMYRDHNICHFYISFKSKETLNRKYIIITVHNK